MDAGRSLKSLVTFEVSAYTAAQKLNWITEMTFDI